MSRLQEELVRVFGDPPVAPRAVVRVQIGSGQGLHAGREEADRLVDAGAELVVVDSDGTSPAALATLAALLDLEPVAVVPRGGTADWKREVVDVRNALRRVASIRFEPELIVQELDDPPLGRLVGLLTRLVERHTPVLLGGGTTTAIAALVASRVQPEARRYLLAGSMPPVKAGALALEAAGLKPLVDLGLTTGAADVAVAVVRAGLDQLDA
jgi:nicotinate-nucleotide--dimethylbenzimidazole phosphoribosyltransferase